MKKYSLHLVLWIHDKNDRGENPIYLKITVDRKTSYIATGYHVLPKFWDKKNELVKNTYKLHQHINPDITNKKIQVIQKIVELQVAGKNLSAKEVKAIFSSGKNMLNFFDFAEAFTKEVANERGPGTLKKYTKHLKKIEVYKGSKNLLLDDIDTQFLIDYENYLRSGVKAISGNYAHSLMGCIRMFVNAALRKKLIQENPFLNYNLPTYVQPDKAYLTLKELAAWEDFTDTTTNPVYKECCIYFLLGCYTGLRISDWFNFSIEKHIEGDRILLRPEKTTKKTNGETCN